MKRPAKPEKEKREYVIVNPFNGYHPTSLVKPVKVFIEDTGPFRQRMSIHFEMDFRNGETKDGWIWIDSWERAKDWADQRVGLNTGEPVVRVGGLFNERAPA